MRLLICAGGTGGGVYPALAVLQALIGEIRDEPADENELRMDHPLSQHSSQTAILWVGSVGGMEEDLIERTGVPFEAVPAAGVHGVGLRALPGNLLQLSRGYRRSRRILREFRPDVLFFTGGYVAVPMALAGRKIPSVLYVPDIEPALALKTLARVADHIAVTTEESRVYFPQKARVTVTGYPMRDDLKVWDVDKARSVLGLSPNLPTLLVMGGSKGARSINRALLSVLPDLLAEMQIVHISGRLDWPVVKEARTGLAERLPNIDRYRAFPYLHEEMGAALTAADLALARAGASTLGEFPSFGLPAILVPYPHAWRYQQVNAQYLEARGAAVIIADDVLPDIIVSETTSLMRDVEQRERMSLSMRALARPEAAAQISRLLQDLVVDLSRERM